MEFGGDLLSASVPELPADPSRLNIVALVMVAESATAAIGMETKLLGVSDRYKALPSTSPARRRTCEQMETG